MQALHPPSVRCCHCCHLARTIYVYILPILHAHKLSMIRVYAHLCTSDNTHARKVTTSGPKQTVDRNQKLETMKIITDGQESRMNNNTFLVSSRQKKTQQHRLVDSTF